MATGNILIEGKTMEELKREITCCICQEHYTEPKVLPCLHYFCKRCVLKIALRSDTGKSLLCPECRSKTSLPEGGVDELKTAFFVNRLKSTLSTVERVYGKVDVKCELCFDSENRAEAFCRQCAMFICRDCIGQHKKLKTYFGHEVASLEDLQQGRAKPVSVKKPPAKPCFHHEEPLVIYCFSCKCLICQHCTVKDHRDHDFEFCKKAVPRTKTSLQDKLQTLKYRGEILSDTVDQIQSTKQELMVQGGKVSKDIKIAFKELREILDKREQELLEEASRIVKGKVDRLSVQEKNILLARAEVQSIVDYTEQCVMHGTDNEVMTMQDELTNRLDQEIDKRSKSEKIAEAVDVGVEVKCAEALHQLCQTKASIIQLVDPIKSTVTIKDELEVNKKFTAVLVTRLSKNQITSRDCKVSSSLRSLYSDTIEECTVNHIGAGQYSIEHTPTVRGRHELTIMVDGRAVAGSPFLVFVSIPPSQLGKPVKVYENLFSPTGLAVTSIGELLVAEEMGNVIKFDTKGNRTTLVKQNKVFLRKLEVKDDNIYCIDENSNMILRCSSIGTNIRVQEVKHSKVGQRGLAVVGEEVMLCKMGTQGTVMVYDKELNYQRSIEHRDKGYFWALSADNHGNLYCADRDNAAIQVFSNDGTFLHSFGCNEEGCNMVKGPWGLCVSGHHVYVCNYLSHSISVFTTAGKYVTSFGQRGYSEGNFDWPHSVCVDRDGFVYVSDFNNNRVQCF